jgi:hypothetical protein
MRRYAGHAKAERIGNGLAFVTYKFQGSLIRAFANF